MKSKDQKSLEVLYEQVQNYSSLEEIFESEHEYGLEGFIKAPPKAKFQNGDQVKVIDPQRRWKTYQSNKSKEAVDQTVEIVGYKNIPGAYSKYAVKLSNGKIYAIHSHFLRHLTEEEKKFDKLKEKLPEIEGLF